MFGRNYKFLFVSLEGGIPWCLAKIIINFYLSPWKEAFLGVYLKSLFCQLSPWKEAFLGVLIVIVILLRYLDYQEFKWNLAKFFQKLVAR